MEKATEEGAVVVVRDCWAIEQEIHKKTPSASEKEALATILRERANSIVTDQVFGTFSRLVDLAVYGELILTKKERVPFACCDYNWKPVDVRRYYVQISLERLAALAKTSSGAIKERIRTLQYLGWVVHVREWNGKRPPIYMIRLEDDQKVPVEFRDAPEEEENNDWEGF